MKFVVLIQLFAKPCTKQSDRDNRRMTRKRTMPIDFRSVVRFFAIPRDEWFLPDDTFRQLVVSAVELHLECGTKLTYFPLRASESRG